MSKAKVHAKSDKVRLEECVDGPVSVRPPGAKTDCSGQANKARAWRLMNMLVAVQCLAPSPYSRNPPDAVEMQAHDALLQDAMVLAGELWDSITDADEPIPF